MVDSGLPISLAKRIMNKRCLWLVRLDRTDIERLHEADLMGRYNPDGAGLDVVEFAAVYASLPEKFYNDPSGKKESWRIRMENALKEMLSKKDSNKLNKQQLRHSTYTNVMPTFADRNSTVQLRAVQSTAFTPVFMAEAAQALLRGEDEGYDENVGK